MTGLLSFYDEKAGHLADCIASFAGAGIDRLVAVDGAYALFPDGTSFSGGDQHDAIRGTCLDHGIGCTLYTPPAVWAGNEVEKRTLLFRLGHAHCEPYDDWLFVIDADETVAHVGDWRGQLEQTGCDVCAVLHGEPAVRPRTERRLFRAHPGGITVRQSHFFYIDGDHRVLWGPGQIDRELVDIRILHEPLKRAPERNRRRNGYYDARVQTNSEPALW